MAQSLYINHNCYAMLEEIRTELNEYNSGLMAATETGAYDNTDIVRKINMAQRYIFNILFPRIPDFFLTSSSVTGSSGVYTKPSDFYKLSHIIDSDGNMLRPISVKIKHLTSNSGSSYLYYEKGNTYVRDDGTSTAVTFWYYKTVKELTQGMTSAGGALSMTLATTAKAEADYYNGIVIESVTGGWDDTISDYTSARVATITNTSAASQYYGTVSELPEPFHHLISRRATLMLKNAVVSPQDNKSPEVGDFREDLVETLRAYVGSKEDVTQDEIWYSFQPYL